MSKKPLFSVTAADCDWSYYVGPGNGGQKRQKTKSGVICTHRASGAQSRCHEDRMQLQNKKHAFRKMTETSEFKNWIKLESAKRTGAMAAAEAEAERQLGEAMTEVKDENGKWVKVRPEELKDEEV